jgi:hypothetical protein
MVYFHIQFHMLSNGGSAVITAKREVKHNISCGYYVLLYKSVVILKIAVTSEALMTVNIRIVVFWSVMSCSLMGKVRSVRSLHNF